jgi:Flp pilus assembly protein TadG
MKLRALKNSDSGQAVVETALFLPALLLLLVGAIDLGRLSQYDTKLASGARAGAQYGSLNLVTADDSAGMKAAVQSDTGSMTGLTISPSTYCTCAGGGGTVACTATACSGSHRLLYVSVSVTGTFKPLFNYFGGTSVARTKTATLEVGQ